MKRHKYPAIRLRKNDYEVAREPGERRIIAGNVKMKSERNEYLHKWPDKPKEACKRSNQDRQACFHLKCLNLASVNNVL